MLDLERREGAADFLVINVINNNVKTREEGPIKCSEISNIKSGSDYMIGMARQGFKAYKGIVKLLIVFESDINPSCIE